jgi:ATP-dependent DNA helicase RecG
VSLSLTALSDLLCQAETEHLEFKEAKNTWDFDELARYCAAFANECGGKMILGVRDGIPRKVVGTSAFADVNHVKTYLLDALKLRIEVDELKHPDGRVLVFNVPSRPKGMPCQYKGAYLMRSGESLVSMTPDQLKRIFDETVLDFSAEVCPSATLCDLDADAVLRFRQDWCRKSANAALQNMAVDRVLKDAELVVDDRITYAALVLFGNERALGKFLPQSEVVFEYRSSESSIAHAVRREFRFGFFLSIDKLLGEIDARNEVQHFQDGLFMRDIPTLNDAAVREAILNAISHREYTMPGSVFVRQSPRGIQVESPGGFPPGITPKNILHKQVPRNRRIAEAFGKCGLVERSGQGMDRMFRESVKEGKQVPDFAGTDDFQVVLTLNGQVRDPAFLNFLQKIGEERMASFTTEDFLVLDLAQREQPIPDDLKDRQRYLAQQGVLEAYGRGRGRRYILSRQFYRFTGKKGIYTRRRGLDRATNKELLIAHLKDNRREGSRLQELMEVLPALSRGTVQGLLRELEREGRSYHSGRTKASRWYPKAPPDGIAS